MSHHKKLTSLIALSLFAVGIHASARLSGQDEKKPLPPALEKAKEDFYTVADYNAPEPVDSLKRVARKVRAKRYNLQAEKGVDPAMFMITEARESGFGLPSSHAPAEPALPVAQSDAVIMGEVKGAAAFFSEDKVSIRSEFAISVDDILKNNVGAPFSVGDSIDAVRGGGGVRFASGKVIRFGDHGKPLPRRGRKYVFFLKYNKDGGQDYIIITAYELRAGRVFPLDGVALDGSVIWQYEAYQKYKDAEEQTFLNELKDAISLTPLSAPDGGK